MNPHALVCRCGSLRFRHSLTMFPLAWKATCVRCHEVKAEAHMKPYVKPKPPEPPKPWMHDWNPFN